MFCYFGRKYVSCYPHITHLLRTHTHYMHTETAAQGDDTHKEPNQQRLIMGNTGETTGATSERFTPYLASPKAIVTWIAVHKWQSSFISNFNHGLV